jgi:hypothetical protein
MIKLFLALLVGGSLFAGELLTLQSYRSNEFSPALGQAFSIPFILKEDAKVKIDIYTPDNNLIKTLSADMKRGECSLTWDGKDKKGNVVPDEAYNIVVTAQNSKGSEIIDPRKTGGVVLKDLHTKIDKFGNINYRLSSPARVLVRAGIENGPMLRVISNWVPKNRGKIRQRWNMRDADNLVDISTLPFGITVSAFTLPDHAIITTNNKKTDYYTYFKQNNLLCNIIPKTEQKLKRDGQPISKHYYMCRILDRDPRLYLSMPKNNGKEQNLSVLTNGKPTLVKVTMNPEDEAILEKAKYEVSFFVDFEFVSEEELGFMPISWNFVPNGIDKGEHILTVNVSSFTGQVGVKSYKFILK